MVAKELLLSSLTPAPSRPLGWPTYPLYTSDDDDPLFISLLLLSLSITPSRFPFPQPSRFPLLPSPISWQGYSLRWEGKCVWGRRGRRLKRRIGFFNSSVLAGKPIGEVGKRVHAPLLYNNCSGLFRAKQTIISSGLPKFLTTSCLSNHKLERNNQRPLQQIQSEYRRLYQPTAAFECAA